MDWESGPNTWENLCVSGSRGWGRWLPTADYWANEFRTKSSCFSDSYGHGLGGVSYLLPEQKENSVLISEYVSAKTAKSIVTGFSAEPNGIKFLTIYYHQSSTW